MRTLTHDLKPHLKSLRDEIARGYRAMRRTDPAKAREVHRLMKGHVRQIEDKCVAHLHRAPESVQ